MTNLTTIDHPVGQTQALFPDQVIVTERSPVSTPRLPLRSGQTFEWRRKERVILNVDSDQRQAAIARLPIRRDTPVEAVSTDSLKAEAIKRERVSVDEQVAVDALLDARYLARARLRALLQDLERHPDAQVLTNRPVPTGYMLVRCASASILRSITHEHKTLGIAGIDCLMPASMLNHVGTSLKNLRLEHPSVEVGAAIADGKRISLNDCYARHLWIEPQWDGGVVILPLASDAGQTVYEILGTRRSRYRTRERDWICDCDTLAEAVDLAGLLRASFHDLYASLVTGGGEPPSKVQNSEYPFC